MLIVEFELKASSIDHRYEVPPPSFSSLAQRAQSQAPCVHVVGFELKTSSIDHRYKVPQPSFSSRQGYPAHKNPPPPLGPP